MSDFEDHADPLPRTAGGFQMQVAGRQTGSQKLKSKLKSGCLVLRKPATVKSHSQSSPSVFDRETVSPTMARRW
jgi:hypothetical protein